MLVLVRHGESTANAAKLLLGRTDSALTDQGRAEAAAVGRVLGPVSALYSSPLRRALDTAVVLDVGAPVVDDRWIEVDYGEFEGRPLGEVPAEAWAAWRRDPTFCPQGGEPMTDVGTRVRAACAELFATPDSPARSPEGDAVVVSHVSPIKAAVAWALEGSEEMAWRLHLSNGSITRIVWGPGGPLLETYNEVPPPGVRPGERRLAGSPAPGPSSVHE